MEINKLIEIIKKKIAKEIVFQEINIEDKSFLHKNHKNNSPNKFHIKINIITIIIPIIVNHFDPCFSIYSVNNSPNL